MKRILAAIAALLSVFGLVFVAGVGANQASAYTSNTFCTHARSLTQEGAQTGPSGPRHYEGIFAQWTIRSGNACESVSNSNNRVAMGIMVKDAVGHYMLVGTGRTGSSAGGCPQVGADRTITALSGAWNGLLGMTPVPGVSTCIWGAWSFEIRYNPSNRALEGFIGGTLVRSQPNVYTTWTAPFDLEVLDECDNYCGDSNMEGDLSNGGAVTVTNMQMQAYSNDGWSSTCTTNGSAPGGGLNGFQTGSTYGYRFGIQVPSCNEVEAYTASDAPN